MMKLNQNIFLVAFFVFISNVMAAADKLSLSGPKTEVVPTGNYTKLYYVDVARGDDGGKGTKEAPWKSLAAALSKSVVEAQGRTAILVAEGVYAVGGLSMRSKVDMFGGFSSSGWNRDIERYRSVIDGSGKRQLLIGASDARIDGFTLSNGAAPGNGGAILCIGESPIITNNVFSNNKTLKPEQWNPKYMHMTANDGGAVYGEKGAAPIIKNNLFINNTTQNGRGAAIAFNNKCKPVIDNNVFINNRAGLEDPMRSSDGGAVSVFNWCNAVISNNVFLGNKALAKNDGGAIFVALWSSAKITGNIIVDSESGDDAGALFVGGQEHRYDTALDPIPAKEKFYVTIADNRFIGNKNPTMNSGVMRFTMEARGEFTNNITAFNTGVYFQRSEVAVKENLILDNFLFIETKEGLKQGSIENNFIGGDFRLETPAKVENNRMRENYNGGINNKAGLPSIKDDGKNLSAASVIFNRTSYTTDIFSTTSLPKNSLVNRVVKSGDKWGVIKSNDGVFMTVWGDLNGASEFTILPTYSLSLK